MSRALSKERGQSRLEQRPRHIGLLYRFTILLKDANQELVGEIDCYDAPTGLGVSVDSELPLVFIATAGTVDNDPVNFWYGSQDWDSRSGECKVGGYDSGSRRMDCGFTC